jgi:hypothetical protein
MAERYATPLPQLERDELTLAKVDSYLQEMGFAL